MRDLPRASPPHHHHTNPTTHTHSGARGGVAHKQQEQRTPRTPHSQHKGRRRKKKKATYLPTYLFWDFLRFSGLILENIFMVFSGSSCRETAKNAIKTIDGKRRKEKSFFFSIFSAKSF
jgi:hypothetical protein